MGDPGVEKLSRRGLSIFLAEHEDCGGGFEVQRREGSAGSLVRVICGGCGQSIEYPAAADEELIGESGPRGADEPMSHHYGGPDLYMRRRLIAGAAVIIVIVLIFLLVGGC